jgi:hypothetical protein
MDNNRSQLITVEVAARILVVAAEESGGGQAVAMSPPDDRMTDCATLRLMTVDHRHSATAFDYRADVLCFLSSSR